MEKSQLNVAALSEPIMNVIMKVMSFSLEGPPIKADKATTKTDDEQQGACGNQQRAERRAKERQASAMNNRTGAAAVTEDEGVAVAALHESCLETSMIISGTMIAREPSCCVVFDLSVLLQAFRPKRINTQRP